MKGMFFSVRNCCTTSDVWLGVNAPSHTLLVVQQFLADKSIPVITHPLYSPALAPSDFWLFPSLKMGLKGPRFKPWKTSNATTELQKIPKEAFRRCFQQWQDRWSKYVRVRKGSTLKVIR
jgi:hypothetical protein